MPWLFNSLKPSGDSLFTGHHIIIGRFLDCAEDEVVIAKVALKYAVDLIHCFKPYIQIQTTYKCQNMNVNFIVKKIYSQKTQNQPHIIALTKSIY